MHQHALLIATHDDTAREFLSSQFDADGDTVYLAESAAATTASLCAHAIDVLLLGDCHAPAVAPALLRALRARQLHTRVHPAQPVVTIGDPGEMATVRAYEAGSDHHLARDSSYLVIRAVIAAVARRSLHSCHQPPPAHRRAAHRHRRTDRRRRRQQRRVQQQGVGPALPARQHEDEADLDVGGDHPRHPAVGA
jgi:DNA-binding response OmpR family regulator